MKYQQIKLRIEALILKDEQMIRGYNLSISNSDKMKWNSIIGRLEASKKRKEVMLECIKSFPRGNFNWKQICSDFQIKYYKQ